MNRLTNGKKVKNKRSIRIEASANKTYARINPYIKNSKRKKVFIPKLNTSNRLSLIKANIFLAILICIFVSCFMNKNDIKAYFTDSKILSNSFSIEAEYTVTYNSNTGTGTMNPQEISYNVETNITPNNFTKSGYSFNGWNTSPDGSGTSYSNRQLVNNLTTINENTIILYAQWEVETEATKYAVQIYGINQDEDSNGNILGLTFGPAVGDNYNNSYVTHEYEETPSGSGSGIYKIKIITHKVSATGNETISSVYLKNSSGNEVTRTQEEVTARQNISLHNMGWAEIAAVSDKTLFTDCMLCGDTKSVRLNLNSTISSGKTYTQYGDGAGVIYGSIKNDVGNEYYRTWNPGTTQNSAATNSSSIGTNAKEAGGYSSSHIRATLIGENNKTDVTYAGNINLTSSTCLFSCIESDLRSVITAKKIKYVTGESSSSYSLNDDIADSIWLFSDREMYGTAPYSGNTIEGIGQNGDGYDKFRNTESKTYISSYNINASTNRACYNEAGRAGSYWLRSPYLNRENDVRYVSGTGSISDAHSSVNYSFGFGFCIE